MVDFSTSVSKEATFTLNPHGKFDADPSVQKGGIKFSQGHPDTA
jgi:hypothetical protein